VLYPEGLAQRRWLERYAECFGCVEVNSAFYRLPERATFERWCEQTPEGFVVAVKVSRYLTHVKRLNEPDEPVARLVERAAGLGPRLGPYLLQLPPNLKADPERLDACLAAFPDDARVAVEPRHETWWTDEVRDVLSRHDAALCWADRGSKPLTPLWVTAGWGYLRMHQGIASPPTAYGDQALATWLERITDAHGDHDVFVLFNNDHGGAAVRNALAFRHLAER
jgi:uncharacterized protein YecE (DUF72 family)